MTDVVTDYLIDKAIYDRLTAAGIDTPEPLAPPELEQHTAVQADGYPGNVIAGELIESAWGNATVATLRNVSPTLYVNSATVLHDRLLVMGGNNSAVNTDPASNFRITFAAAFSAPPLFVINNAYVPTFPACFFAINTISAADVVVYVSRSDGTPFPNNTLEVSWIAMGRR